MFKLVAEVTSIRINYNYIPENPSSDSISRWPNADVNLVYNNDGEELTLTIPVKEAAKIYIGQKLLIDFQVVDDESKIDIV